jgi:hypothetical protein
MWAAMLDEPVLPLPEDLTPEVARALKRPSEHLLPEVQRMHALAIDLLRVQLVRPLITYTMNLVLHTTAVHI